MKIMYRSDNQHPGRGRRGSTMGRTHERVRGMEYVKELCLEGAAW